LLSEDDLAEEEDDLLREEDEAEGLALDELSSLAKEEDDSSMEDAVEKTDPLPWPSTEQEKSVSAVKAMFRNDLVFLMGYKQMAGRHIGRRRTRCTRTLGAPLDIVMVAIPDRLPASAHIGMSGRVGKIIEKK